MKVKLLFLLMLLPLLTGCYTTYHHIRPNNVNDVYVYDVNYVYDYAHPYYYNSLNWYPYVQLNYTYWNKYKQIKHRKPRPFKKSNNVVQTRRYPTTRTTLLPKHHINQRNGLQSYPNRTLIKKEKQSVRKSSTKKTTTRKSTSTRRTKKTNKRSIKTTR